MFCIVAIVLLTPMLGIVTSVFVLIVFIVIVVTRGGLEKRYEADFRHYIISFAHAIAIIVTFMGVIIYALIMS